ncbi:helix-turn-helix transcriptional regulator [Frankia sp. CNm7]|uniref:Helix-turn-helix transcriptional regulator n=1 Tax=Frankia nepalensis TaxID=1836974 RepID=A0A937UQ16_9ACTN|nr:helix-turn-helix transcriptional regulator [Frankia nepalensis]MBL7501334.1 helix-turn-helix transcriptional regulator [Frankia nepalensis]MBL7509879.1 helix-turn-helix transcriptional regulator [Frankia nepalensis]MBL7520682.1 helix-turn-helix transcriptional regulator [Frankia nepalensis]MBL7629638.1 helix-turn-helix transcriptional regulator [Frankia nepalensis]
MNPRTHRTSDPPMTGARGGPSGGDPASAVHDAGVPGRAGGRARPAGVPGAAAGPGGPPPGATGERPAYPLPGLPGPAHDVDAPVYVISIAAELAGMHPQTLRSYDRLGLVTPGRTAGRGRRYSARDVALLREVQRLSQEEGVNLEGIRQILQLGAQVLALQAEVRALHEELAKTRAEADRRVAEAHASHRRDLVPVDRGAIVIWRPGPRR